jgi:lipoprotein-anchoring transpeptidase ErfK/SrfK
MAARLAFALACAAVLLAGCASRGQPGSPGAGPLASGNSAPAGIVVSPPGSAAPTSAGAEAPDLASAAASVPRPKPKPINRCAANTAAQLVMVSVRTQHAWMCAKTKRVYDSAVTTGMSGNDTSTPTGTFHIQAKDTNTVLTLNTGAQYDVKYWIPFSAPLYGFHDSSWQHFPYGSTEYRTHGSHGCIHMPLRAMAFLYRWADIGAVVRIRA